MIVCTAIVGKNNGPLFLQSYVPTTGTTATGVEPDELKFHYIVHTALDVVEERVDVKRNKKGTKINYELFLGLLYPTEEYKVYGYITNTKIKLIVVVSEDHNEGDVRNFFRRFHTLFTNHVCNPFYTPDQPITSKGFANEVKTLATISS
ncbi:Trafficking protein particle complex subunit 2-like protein [Balamuthia mandrillaris]